MRKSFRHITAAVLATLMGATAPEVGATSAALLWNLQMHSMKESSLWSVLTHDYSLQHHTDNHAVQVQIKQYSHNPAYIQLLTRNAGNYLYYVLSETQKRGIPAEIALLPMVESDYNPFCTSSKSASGLWQLMPSTAEGFGIKTNSWYDGRRDVVASTNVALGYLSYLHDLFHDWLLALAAYNAGEGRVMRAIAHNKQLGKPTDFWSLSLPQETRQYVPKLLALAALIQNPSAYGVKVTPVANQPFFTSVPMRGTLTLSTLASWVHTPVKTLHWLNPALRKNVIEPKPTQSYYVLVPVNGDDTPITLSLKSSLKDA